MLYSTDETGWLERRAWEIAMETGWPMPNCKLEAMAELQRIRMGPKASVTPIAERKPSKR